MDVKAFAKINLGLDVLGKRDDGYHEVRMIMQSIGLCDEISLEVLEEDVIRLSLEGAGPDVPEDERNIMYKAAALLKEHCSLRQGVYIRAVKHIPSQAGLGGGSADAAAVLKGMNSLFELGLDEKELRELGVRLGADVPFCIMEGTALAEGIGEVLTPIKKAPHLYVLLAKPSEGVATGGIYKAIDESGLMEDEEGRAHRKDCIDGLIRACDTGDIKELCGDLINIFEPVTEARQPLIAGLRQRMLELGALGALMSGSGPTVYGLFDDSSMAEAARKGLEAMLSSGELSDLVLTEFV